MPLGIAGGSSLPLGFAGGAAFSAKAIVVVISIAHAKTHAIVLFMVDFISFTGWAYFTAAFWQNFEPTEAKKGIFCGRFTDRHDTFFG